MPSHYEKGRDLFDLAKSYGRRGLHAQAADAFRRAANCFEAAAMDRLAEVAWTMVDHELEHCEPPAPPNVSALVD